MKKQLPKINNEELNDHFERLWQVICKIQPKNPENINWQTISKTNYYNNFLS